MATMKDAPRGSRPPGLMEPHSHTHENVRHGGPKVRAGDGHPRKHPAPYGPVPDKGPNTFIGKNGKGRNF